LARGAIWAALAASSWLLACGGDEGLAPVADPTQTLAIDRDPAANVVEVHLVASPATVMLDGRQVAVWAYADGDGEPTVPGPMIVADRGDLLRVRFDNRLDDATTVHFHGPRLPNEMDGAPVGGALVLPGESFDYVFPLQDAGTFWYHPHWSTAEQVERGLYGQLVVREPSVDAASERFFVLDDVDFDEAGQIELAPSQDDLDHGRHGATILVNGRVTPRLDVARRGLERWHFTNAANGRYFALRLAGHQFSVIGTDGGLLESPYQVDRLLLTPGSRLDVVVAIDAAKGDALTLVSEPIDDAAPDQVRRDVLTLAVGAEIEPAPNGWRERLPRRSIPAIDVEAAAERTITLGKVAGPVAADVSAFHVNGESWPFADPEQGKVGDVEIWSIVNNTDHREPFHLHGTFVEPLSINGLALPRREAEDVVDIPAGATVRLAVPFEREGNWMFHSHILEHAELGMMRVLRLVP
jgi:FtsP/CotA-like multicopper oxidase with cupredoxin domain